jgi:hypothetical protein
MMKRIAIGLGVVALLAAAGMGCKTVDQKSADYHQWRAERATAEGNYGKAHEHERKADKAQAKVPSDPLP